MHAKRLLDGRVQFGFRVDRILSPLSRTSSPLIFLATAVALHVRVIIHSDQTFDHVMGCNEATGRRLRLWCHVDYRKL